MPYQPLSSVGADTTRRPARGFTLAEMLVALVLMAIVGGGIMAVVVRQQRFYAGTSAIMEMRSGLRQALGALPADLRGISPAGGDIYAMSEEAIEFRATTGSSVVCVIPIVGGTTIIVPPRSLARNNTLTAWLATPEVGDSLLIYTEGPSLGGADDGWRRHGISAVDAVAGGCPASTGLTTAADVAEPSYRLTLSNDLDPTTVVGGPIRVFRRVRYELYQAPDNLWYLGFRDCLSSRATPCPALQPVSGPYRPLSATVGQSGLSLTYFDINGAATNTPAAVARIDLAVRAKTERRADGSYIAGGYRDSLTMVVSVRNRP